MQVQAFVGIDLSQDTMTVVWWEPFQVHDTAVFPRTEAGCAALYQWCVRRVVRYRGLAPVVPQSGRRSGLGYGVCHSGNRWVRRALYLAALSAVRHSARYKRIYEGVLARGKARKVALVAVARRLGELLYALQRDGADYDPSRLDKDLAFQDRISLRSE